MPLMRSSRKVKKVKEKKMNQPKQLSEKEMDGLLKAMEDIMHNKKASIRDRIDAAQLVIDYLRRKK